MYIKYGQLKKLVREAIAISPKYLEKEKVRQELQSDIVAAVKSGKISSQEELEQHFQNLANNPDFTLALTALRAVPFNIWKKLQ